MDQTDIELLSAVGDLLSEAGINVEPAEIDGRIVLELESRSELVDEEFDCTVSVCHPSKDTTAVQLLAPVFYELDEDQTVTAARLLPELNYFLEIGSFGCLPEEGYIYFSHSFLTNGLDEESVLRCFPAYLETVAATALRGRELLLPVINGELPPGEIRPEELRVIQF